MIFVGARFIGPAGAMNVAPTKAIVSGLAGWGGRYIWLQTETRLKSKGPFPVLYWEVMRSVFRF
jgi:hypothetical protein